MEGAYRIDFPFVKGNKKDIKCEKCNISSSFFYVSLIDKKIICPCCFMKEKEYEEYKKARELNRLAILRGDSDFSGILYKKPKKDFKIII